MPVAGTKCCMAGFGNCGHSGAEADSVQPKNSVAQLIQFNTGFNIVKDGFCIAEERPGNILLHTGVNDRGVWINEFTHIIARTGPIPVLNSTKTGIEPPVGKLPIGANQVVITRLYLAGWVHIARCQVSWFPVCAIIKNGRIETGVTVLVGIGFVCIVAPVEWVAVCHFIIIYQQTDGGITCPVMIAVGAVIAPYIAAAFILSNGERSEEHTSELQSLMRISYAVFCLKKKKLTNNSRYLTNI